MKCVNLFLVLVLAIGWLACGCDDTEEGIDSDQNFHDDSDHDSAAYPYFLVIGGGLSETLSVLRVEENRGYTMYDDLVATGSAINQTLTDGEDFFAVCSLSNSVVVYDLDLNVKREVSVGEGVNPMSMVLADDELAWVSGFVSNDVRLVDLSAGADERVLEIIPMPAGDDLPRDPGVEHSWTRPGGMARVGERVFMALSHLEETYVAAGPGLVAVIDEQQGELETVLELTGRDTMSLTYDAQRGVVWAVSAGDYVVQQGFTGNGLLEAIDPQTLEIVARVDIDGAPFELLTADAFGYLCNGRDGNLLVVDLDDGAQRQSIDLRRHEGDAGLSFVSALALDPAGFVYAAEFNSDYLYVLDPARDHEIVAEFAVNDGPDTLTFIP
ncbi:MAG TPA: hypothetical protein PKW95_06840 [bacterium]|nr:hypothetical protein [bacterium]